MVELFSGQVRLNYDGLAMYSEDNINDEEFHTVS